MNYELKIAIKELSELAKSSLIRSRLLYAALPIIIFLASCASSPKPTVETPSQAPAVQEAAKTVPTLNMSAELAKIDTMFIVDSPNAAIAHEHFLRALDMMEGEKYQFAELFYKRALAYDPNSHFLLSELIKVSLLLNKNDDVFSLLKLSVQQKEATSEDFLLLGRAYRDRGNLDSAIFYYKIATEKREGDLSALYEYSQLLQAKQNFPELKKIYDILLVELDYPSSLLEKQIMLYAFTQTPDSVTAELLGAAFRAKGMENPEYGFAQAKILASLKKYSEANEILLTIFFMHPSKELTSALALQIANNYELMDSTTVAVIWLEQIISQDPENHVAMNNLGYMLINKDIDVPRGLSLVESALKYLPDEQSYLDSKAWGLYKSGKYEEALKIFEQLESVGMDVPEFWEHIAKVCEALKLYDRAKAYRAKAGNE